MHLGILNVSRWGKGGGVCSRASTDGETTSAKTAKWHFIWKITPRKNLSLLLCWVRMSGNPLYSQAQLSGRWPGRWEMKHSDHTLRTCLCTTKKYRTQRISSDPHYGVFCRYPRITTPDRRAGVETHLWGSSKLFISGPGDSWVMSYSWVTWSIANPRFIMRSYFFYGNDLFKIISISAMFVVRPPVLGYALIMIFT